MPKASASAAGQRAMIGHIGKYVVEKKLDEGGFGQVFLAFDSDVGQPVAIKKLRGEGDPELVKRFQLEVRTTAGLRHKNIVTIHASGEEDGDPYLVMEFLEGQNLRQVINERRSFSLLDKARIMTQVAEGLAYAHSKGVVHRDVKPANIMLLPDDTVKIMDFGIALGPNRKTDITQTGVIPGTPFYLAPEQLEGAKANERTDIFSFGDVYYELLTGLHPFEQYKHDWKLLQIAILSLEPRPVGELVPGCPEALESLVHRTLAKDPEFRYQTFQEVLDDNEAILADLKHEGAATILREIPSLLESDDLHTAGNKIRRAYQMEPRNREVRRLREEINLRIQREQKRSRAAELLPNAEKQMGERRYAEAVQTLEACAKLDSANVAVKTLLDEARARKDANARAIRLVSEARFLQQKGLLDEAGERLREALASDPDHTDAKRLDWQIQVQVERRRLEEERQQAIREAREHQDAGRFAEALAALDEIEKSQPGAVGVAELRVEIRHEQEQAARRRRAEEFNQALATARSAMQAGNLEGAPGLLDQLEQQSLGEPGAAEAVRELRYRLVALVRAAEIAQYQRKVRALLQDKSFRPALDLLAEALRKFPEDAGLERLNRSAEDLYQGQRRSEAIAAMLKDAATRRDGGDLQEALDFIRQGCQDLGEEAAFHNLARQLEMEIEHQRYSAALEALLKDAREMLAAARYSEAIDRLMGASEFAEEAEVRSLLESARVAAAMEEERRFVEEMVAAAANLESQGEYAGALSAVEQALVRYPHNSHLAQSADRLRDRVKEEQHRSLIERRCAAIRVLTDEGDWQQARSALRAAHAEFAGEAAFDDLAKEVEAGFYEDGWRRHEGRVRQHLAAGAVSQAEDSLEDQANRTLYGRDPRWQGLAQEVAERRAYEEVLLEADRRRNAGRLGDAEDLLTEIMQRPTPDSRARQKLDLIQVQRSEAERQREIARLAEAIRERLKSGEPVAAAPELAAARARFPGEVVWAELETEIHTRQAEARRRDEIAALAQNIRRLLTRERDRPPASIADITATAMLHDRRDEWGPAMAALDAASAKYPGEQTWDTLRTEIDAARALLSARSKIAQILQYHLEHGELDQAEAELAAARARYPGEVSWPVFDAELRRRREFERSRAHVEQLASSVRDCLRRNNIGQARRELDLARTRHPGEPIWAVLQTAAEIADLVQRDAADTPIAQVWAGLRGATVRLDQAHTKSPDDEIWDVLEAGIAKRRTQLEHAFRGRVRACPDLSQLDRIDKELSEARARYPNEPSWAVLQSELDVRRKTLERASIAEFQARARQCLERDDVQAARIKLDQARQRHPGLSEWDVLERDIEARQQELLRQQALDTAERSVRQQLARVDEIPKERDWSNPIELQWEALEKAAMTAAGARAYPEEDRFGALEREVAEKRVRWQQQTAREVTEAIRKYPGRETVRWFAPQIGSLCAKAPAQPLWTSLKSEIDALDALLTRQAEVTAFAERVRAPIARDDLRQAASELNAGRVKYPDEPLWTTLQTEIDGRRALLEQRQREARGRDRVRLIAIERQVGIERRKRKRKALQRTASGIATAYADDEELQSIVARIRARIVTVPSPHPLPWKLIGGSTGAAAILLLLALGRWINGKNPHPAKPGVFTEIPIEIRTDPPGASVRVGERSCVTPNCRIDVALGSYPVEAQLKGYEPQRQTVTIDPSSRLVDLTMRPLPPAAPPGPATGTLVVRTAVPDVLVYLDGSPHARTDQSGSVVLPLEVKAYEVRVERNGYEKPPPKLVRITAGATQTLIFPLVLQNAQLEMRGAPANLEVTLDGTVLGRTDGSAAYVFPAPVRPGDHLIAVPRGSVQIGEQPGARSLVERFDPGVTVRLTWKEPAIAPPPPNPEEQDWIKIRDSAAVTQLRAFLKKYPGGRHTSEAESSLDRLVWAATNKENLESLWDYLREFPAGAHAADANAQIAEDSDWEKVRDTSDPSQLRVFLGNHPNSRHRQPAESSMDRLAWANTKKDGLESLLTYIRDFPAGSHVNAANAQIADLIWKGVDQTSEEQLRNFLRENSSNPHTKDAQALLDRIAAARQELEKQVDQTLNAFNQAATRKQDSQLKAVWPGIDKGFLEGVHTPGERMSLTRSGNVSLAGGSARAPCTLTSVFLRKTQSATVQLQRSGDHWVIASLKVGP